VKVRRGLVEDSIWAGIIASATDLTTLGATLDLESVVVRRTATGAEPGSGNGLAFDLGARVTLKAGYLEGNRSAGIRGITWTADGPRATLTATDLVIVETGSDDDGHVGRGINLINGCSATVTRALLAANREISILAISEEGMPASTVELRDVTIRETRAAACADLEESDPRSCRSADLTAGGGTALGAAGGTITIQRFELAHNATCGLQVSRDGHIAAADGEIHHNPIGANVQVADYDVESVVNATVRYFDNDANLASTALPVPEPGPLSRWLSPP